MKKLFDFSANADVKVRFLDTDAFQTHPVRELIMPEGMSAVPCTLSQDTGCPHCDSVGKPTARNYMGVVEQVQVRTHRKKRINKKWAKRYGFKAGDFKVVSMKQWRDKL